MQMICSRGARYAAARLGLFRGRSVSFKATVKNSALIVGGAPQSFRVEIREDPLTGRTSRVFNFPSKLALPSPDLDNLLAGSEKHCPFCPANISKVTPSFGPEILPQGILQYKDLRLFPNLMPYDGISAVLTLGDAHFVSMLGWAVDNGKRIARALSVAMEFFSILNSLKHSESVHNLLWWNYMPPSGGSLVHPHMQVFATSTPPNRVREELLAAETYYAQSRRCFWEDLAEEEARSGERFLGNIGETRWMMSFAPSGMIGDIIGVVRDAPSVLELSPRMLLDLAVGISRAAAAYESVGVWSFNLSLLGGTSRGDNSTRVRVIFTPRIVIGGFNSSDCSAMQVSFGEALSLKSPEELQKLFRPFFSADASPPASR
eukprot:RCo037763